MRKILVPVDFSPASEDALRHAWECACDSVKQILLLHVIDPLEIANLALINLEGYEARLREKKIAEAEERLEALAKKYGREGVTIQTRVIVDRPWRGIVHTAIEEGADAIVMGSQGRGVVTETLVGSVAERTLRHAPMPVTVLKPREACRRAHERWRMMHGHHPERA